MTEQIDALAGPARDTGDYAGEQFMQWFIKEQVEEVSSMTSLLKVVERARENPLWPRSTWRVRTHPRRPIRPRRMRPAALF